MESPPRAPNPVDGGPPKFASLSELATYSLKNFIRWNNATPEALLEWKITLSEPDMQAQGNELFIAYDLTIRTTCPGFEPYSLVNRRYRDFEWVRQQLAKAYPNHILPPLPSKTLLNRFEKSFLDGRRNELEVFLRRLISMRVLHENPALHVFLQGDDEALTRQKVASEHRPVITTILGALETLLVANGQTKEPDPSFNQARAHWLSVESQMVACHKRFSAIIGMNEDIANNFTDLAAVASSQSRSHAEGGAALQGLYHRLAQTYVGLAQANQQLVVDVKTRYLDTIKEWQHMATNTIDTLAVRLSSLNHYISASTKCEAMQQKLRNNPISNKNQINFNNAEIAENTARNQFEVASATTAAELKRVSKLHAQEMIAAIQLLARDCSEFHRSAAGLWANLLDFGGEARGYD